MTQLAANYKRLVVKIGSSLFYSGKKLDIERYFEIVSDVAELIKMEDKEIVIVSSGAIALGMESMKINARPRKLPFLQAIASIGQNILMDNYSRHFAKYDVTCAQVLLTWDDFINRQRYLNAKNTLLTLLRLGVVPIINENDTISTEEIKFGDNDRLSSLVAALINADLLIILSDVDGLLDKDKKVIRIIPQISREVKALASSTDKKASVGGMITKIEAARVAADSGIPCIIANGRQGNILSKALNNPADCGTLFIPKKGRLGSRERWIAFGSRPKGKIIVDAGAKGALLNKKSLLSVGVIGLEGNFERGDIVSIADKENSEFARGKVVISSGQLEKAKGRRIDKEVIHRDNIVIL